MTTLADLLFRWKEDGAWVRLKDGREIRLEDFWKEYLDSPEGRQFIKELMEVYDSST